MPTTSQHEILPHKLIAQTVSELVRDTPVYDIHTHLYAPAFDKMLLFGIDELLTYHYLVAETFRFSEVASDDFFALAKAEQAELVWRTLFVERAPISEACRGVVTTLNALGIEIQNDAEGLAKIRSFYASQKPDEFVSRCMEIANVRRICMTNSPFDADEAPVWETFKGDERFSAALRIDPLLMQWESACKYLQDAGFEVQLDGGSKTMSEVRRWLETWAKKMDALYVMVSLPPSFQMLFAADANEEETLRARLIEDAVLPFCREHKLPFALMMGVTRQVNPTLQAAGDSVGLSDLNALKYLCARFPDNKFLVTVLARENQHELCILARKFANLHPFGCWWFTNVPSLIDEITRMRLELLGASFTAQHSDARVMDQVIYKWSHSRAVIAPILAEKYSELARAGWPVTHAMLEQDVTALFGGAFEKFLAR